jgi:hypothetical protein
MCESNAGVHLGESTVKVIKHTSVASANVCRKDHEEVLCICTCYC